MSPLDQLNAAIKQFHLGHYDNAKTLLEEVRKAAPELVMAQLYLAQIDLLSGKGEQWIATLQELIIQIPHFHEAYHVLGQCLQQAKQLPQAAATFHTALTLAYFQVEQEGIPSCVKPNTTSLKPDQGEALLWQTLSLLKQHEVYAFACAGTLLGLEREGHLLINDKDLDIGIDWLQMNKAIEVLEKNGWAEASRSYDLINPRCLKHKATGITLDLCGFGTDSKSGEAICGLWIEDVPFHWNRITVFPKIELTSRPSPAGEVWYLKQPELMLNALYGQGWRIPDADFDTIICAQNLKHFSWLTYCYAYSRLYGQWLRGNTTKAKRILDVLLAQRPKDKVLNQIKRQFEQISSQQNSQQRILALGYFDLMHEGHLNYLEFARQQGDVLVVGIAPDSFCQQSKGYQPIMNETQRKMLITALSIVDETHFVASPISHTQAAAEWIRSLNINKVVCGIEWQGSERWQKLGKALAHHNIDVTYAPKTEGVSTTSIKQKVISQTDTKKH